MINALCLVRLECKVRVATPKTPNLDRPVQTCRREGIRVFRIDRQTHNVMAMSFKHLYTFPCLVPIPELDCHVIGGSEDKGLGWVYDNRSDVVGVCFEGGDLLGGVVVVDTELEVVAAADDPVLAGDETAGSDGDICEFERFDDLL